MEYVNTNSKKIRIKFILIHNNNWWNFFTKHGNHLREAIITNIVKILVCGTKFLGFKEYKCLNCNYIKNIPILKTFLSTWQKMIQNEFGVNRSHKLI